VPAGFIAAILRRGYDRERLLRSLVDRRRDTFVAVADAGVVGYADLRAHSRDLVELTRIYVAPAWKGRGAGRLLFDAALAAARARGASRIEARVDVANEAALSWYLARGFRETGREEFTVGPWVRPVVRVERAVGPS
jgi:ribosomal protein S18 acetylase RimI-like enzyme